MTELTGKALKDRATELNIKGRSKMTADELRAEIAHAEAIDSANDTFAERNPETTALVNMELVPKVSFLDNLKARFAEAREDRTRAGRNAGKFTSITVPLTSDQRRENYVRFNGTSKLTVAQARQLRKKARRNG